ncbi:hypothetical protein NS258_13635 [Sphingomonas sanguinis]|uniref:Uncharacterized protein n=1 Tax=Sphingomonas sanguinis TaxID=33051 RepID=A0A147J671_9SPHN|nr:hypothetical protein NS258_13635 [Sphingomonas sanguinis]
MVDGVDGRVHYVDIGRGDATPVVPEGATVRITPSRMEATQADRTVDAVARANGGRYSVDLHREPGILRRASSRYECDRHCTSAGFHAATI